MNYRVSMVKTMETRLAACATRVTVEPAVILNAQITVSVLMEVVFAMQTKVSREGYVKGVAALDGRLTVMDTGYVM